MRSDLRICLFVLHIAFSLLLKKFMEQVTGKILFERLKQCLLCTVKVSLQKQK